MIGELKIAEIIIGRNYLKKIEITSIFEPVEDRPNTIGLIKEIIK